MTSYHPCSPGFYELVCLYFFEFEMLSSLVTCTQQSGLLRSLNPKTPRGIREHASLDVFEPVLKMKPKKSPPAKGQGTLFSFFSKKQVSAKSEESFQEAKPNNDGNTTSAAAQRTTKADTETLKSDSHDLVGKRIKVFWRDDDNWYAGKVVDFSNVDGKHLVHYDDGDREKLVLSNEKVGCFLRALELDLRPSHAERLR